MKIVNFRVDDAEHQLMHAIAGAAGMTLSGYIRQHFRVLALEKGLVPNPLDALRVQAKVEEPAKPRVTWRPVPQGTNVWAYEVHARRKAGESFADIAESYGADVDTIKRKFKFAEEQIDAGHATPVSSHEPSAGKPALVYDPVDPDNPTEEEQLANADIARQKLVDMGLL